MKNLSRLFIIRFYGSVLFGSSIAFISCTSAESNLQRADIKTALIRNSVKITEDREVYDLEIRANLINNYNNKILATNSGGHSFVNAAGEYELEPVEGKEFFKEVAGKNTFEFTGDNFFWTQPDLNGMLEIDFVIGRGLTLNAGVNFASLQGEHFVGQHIGLGFFKAGENWSFRTDIGFRFQQARIDALHVVTENKASNQDRYVFFYNETIKETHMNFNTGISVNSKNPDWFVNYFFGYSLGWQTFYDYRPQVKKIPSGFPDFHNVNTAFSYTETFHSFHTGIYKNIFEDTRIIAGMRFTQFTDSNGNLFLPDIFMQLDLRMF